ncbi:MAG: sigma-70 family RNA polymerase sigma factor [Myxococcales bacterium]|nr:sigma-70 family RNA polymerase sigma factor [Myxococcales bacterium]
MPDDGALLTAWRAGDLAAGRRLFERYFEATLRFFANKVQTDPEDFVQDVFAACVRGRDRVRDDRSFRAYLFGVAYNVLRDHYRERYRGGSPEPLESHSVEDLAPGPSTMARERQQDALLLDALRRLPMELQVVLELFYWEDMTTAEIGEALGIPSGTVRSRLRRGRERAQALLVELEAGGSLGETTPRGLDDWAREIRASLT